MIFRDEERIEVEFRGNLCGQVVEQLEGHVFAALWVSDNGSTGRSRDVCSPFHLLIADYRIRTDMRSNISQDEI
jgi:hypothetical protein